MIEKYSAGFVEPVASATFIPTEVVVLLTGSTGNLGAEILAALLRTDFVERVYALNRPSGTRSISERHEARFEDREFDTSLLSSPKLVLIEGEMGHPRLGLPDDLYDEVCSRKLSMHHQNLIRLFHSS